MCVYIFKKTRRLLFMIVIASKELEWGLKLPGVVNKQRELQLYL